ncbi:MAG: DNA adenine methylase [Desulfovibrio sp.]|nr:DNA adenine methylase [Desulfovibrio sp.]
MIKFISAKEAAKNWDISHACVAVLCADNRILGAEIRGKMWFIPKTAQKPDNIGCTGFLPDSGMPAKPFLKWAGGKSQILSEIRAKYPTGLGNTITKYAEPFVGAGAVLFDVLSSCILLDVYISDINRELIQTYICIRDEIDELLEKLKTLERRYLRADDNKRNYIYYKCRERFNFLKLSDSKSPELAALFIFLNRTCFNGLYRVNRKGEYNVPMGSYRNPTICDADNLRAVSHNLQGAIVVCADFKESRNFIDKNTFAYFDPPYRPLTVTSSFTSYSQDGFDDRAQADLARFIDSMSEKGAYIIASNSDPKNIDSADNFFDELYAKHKIHRISASRMINSVGDSRGKISELLIVNS